MEIKYTLKYLALLLLTGLNMISCSEVERDKDGKGKEETRGEAGFDTLDYIKYAQEASDLKMYMNSRDLEVDSVDYGYSEVGDTLIRVEGDFMSKKIIKLIEKRWKKGSDDFLLKEIVFDKMGDVILYIENKNIYHYWLDKEYLMSEDKSKDETFIADKLKGTYSNMIEYFNKYKKALPKYIEYYPDDDKK